MTGTKRGPVLLSIGGGAITALLLVAAGLSGTSLTASATTAAPPALPTGCATTVYYAAYDAPVGSNQFGPNQVSHDLAVNVARHATKDCTDPLYAAGDVLFMRDGINASAAEIEALAQVFVADHAKWLAGVEAINAQVSSYTVENISATYDTMGMIPGASSGVMPRIMKFHERHSLGWALVAHLNNGDTRDFRGPCDLQFSAPRFPNVPVTPVTPQVPVTPTTPTTPTTPCTTPAKPNDDTHVYRLSSDKCHWLIVGDNLITGPQAQVPQTDRGSQPAAQVQPAVVPSSEPAAQPTQPVDPTNPPAPTKDGTNGGSTANPVPTGTPTPVDTATHATPIPLPTSGAFG